MAQPTGLPEILTAAASYPSSNIKEPTATYAEIPSEETPAVSSTDPKVDTYGVNTIRELFGNWGWSKESVKDVLYGNAYKEAKKIVKIDFQEFVASVKAAYESMDINKQDPWLITTGKVIGLVMATLACALFGTLKLAGRLVKVTIALLPLAALCVALFYAGIGIAAGIGMLIGASTLTKVAAGLIGGMLLLGGIVFIAHKMQNRKIEEVADKVDGLKPKNESQEPAQASEVNNNNNNNNNDNRSAQSNSEHHVVSGEVQRKEDASRNSPVLGSAESNSEHHVVGGEKPRSEDRSSNPFLLGLGEITTATQHARVHLRFSSKSSSASAATQAPSQAHFTSRASLVPAPSTSASSTLFDSSSGHIGSSFSMGSTFSATDTTSGLEFDLSEFSSVSASSSSSSSSSSSVNSTPSPAIPSSNSSNKNVNSSGLRNGLTGFMKTIAGVDLTGTIPAGDKAQSAK